MRDALPHHLMVDGVQLLHMRTPRNTTPGNTVRTVIGRRQLLMLVLKLAMEMDMKQAMVPQLQERIVYQ